jgi:hypothetical protein
MAGAFLMSAVVSGVAVQDRGQMTADAKRATIAQSSGYAIETGFLKD